MVWISNLLLSYLENVKNKATTLQFLWGHKQILQSKRKQTHLKGSFQDHLQVTSSCLQQSDQTDKIKT